MAKTKVLISFAVTAKLICVYVFAYAKIRFSHNEAHIFQFSELMDGNDRSDIRGGGGGGGVLSFFLDT